MNLKIRELEALRAVMELGSITAAARRLHVTQPAISKMLSQSEGRLGFRCFVREHGRLIPTAEGRALLPEVMKVLTASDAVHRFADDLREGRSGLVSLAAVPSICTSLLPPAIRTFRAGRPLVSVAMAALNNHEVIRSVAEHQVDLGLVLLPTEDGETQSRDLCSARLQCVLPPGHRLAALDRIGPRDLAGVPLISVNRDRPVGTLIARAFESEDVRLEIVIAVTQSTAALALARAGAGVAIVDGFALIGQTVDNLAVRPFVPARQVTCRLLWSRHHPITRLASNFVEALVGEAALIGASAPVR